MPRDVSDYRNIRVPDTFFNNGFTVISSLSNFPVPVSGVITLPADSCYLIVGTVDLGVNRIVCAGSCILKGNGVEVSYLVSSSGNVVVVSSSFSLKMEDLRIVSFAGTASMVTCSNNLHVSRCYFFSLGGAVFSVETTNSGKIHLEDIDTYLCKGFLFNGTTNYLQILDCFKNSTFTSDQTFFQFAANSTLNNPALISGCRFNNSGVNRFSLLANVNIPRNFLYFTECYFNSADLNFPVYENFGTRNERAEFFNCFGVHGQDSEFVVTGTSPNESNLTTVVLPNVFTPLDTSRALGNQLLYNWDAGSNWDFYYRGNHKRGFTLCLKLEVIGVNGSSPLLQFRLSAGGTVSKSVNVGTVFYNAVTLTHTTIFAPDQYVSLGWFDDIGNNLLTKNIVFQILPGRNIVYP